MSVWWRLEEREGGTRGVEGFIYAGSEVNVCVGVTSSSVTADAAPFLRMKPDSPSLPQILWRIIFLSLLSLFVEHLFARFIVLLYLRFSENFVVFLLLL